MINMALESHACLNAEVSSSEGGPSRDQDSVPRSGSPSHTFCRLGIRKGQSAGAEIDIALQGSTGVPQSGGIVKR